MNDQTAPKCSDDLGNTITKSRTVNQAKKWVFTWNNYSKTDNWKEMLQNMIKSKCKKAIFGKEIAPSTQTKHLQGAIELKIKSRPSELELPKSIHWEIMKGTWIENENYCSKEGIVYKYGFPKELKLISQLYPWQKTIENEIKTEPDDRTINWVFDLNGNMGKTVFCKYMAHTHDTLIATAGSAKDIANLLTNALEAGKDLNNNCVFIFNFSRDCDKISYNALEAVKDGLMTNIKYEAKTLVFNSPHVWVFSNQYPDKTKLSEDRWKIYYIDENKNLKICETTDENIM